MGKSRFLVRGLCVALALVWAGSALAQSAAAPATDPRKSAFLALPEADRIAAQEALGWLALYNGALDGAYGKRTGDSIAAYQQSVGAIADGVVTPVERFSRSAGHE